MDNLETSPDTAAAPIPAAGQPAPAVWRQVLGLVWPVLTQQFLILAVGLSDRWLAGNFRPDDPEQHVAYQSAQTTAHYLAWFLSSYTVLVSVGSTALVARFVGAGDRTMAVHATNQSILLAVGLGLLGSAVGLAGLDGLVWLL